MSVGMDQRAHYERFLHLHDQGFVMPNAWDGTSAILVAQAGFQAIGTSSAAIASALGRLDGNHAVSLEEHLANAVMMGRLTDLPINGDFEDGYGATPEDVGRTVEAAIAAGLAGIGVEDTSANPDQPIRSFDDAVARVKAAARVAKGRLVLTGRTDNYLQGRSDLDDTIKRLTAFAEVGADVLFAPYPTDLAAVSAIVKAVAPKPVNLVVGTMTETVPVAELLRLGVRRISMGGAFYARAMTAVRDAAQQLAAGDIASATASMGFREIKKLIAERQR